MYRGTVVSTGAVVAGAALLVGLLGCSEPDDPHAAPVTAAESTLAQPGHAWPGPRLPDSTLPRPVGDDPASGSYRSVRGHCTLCLGASGHYTFRRGEFHEAGSWHRTADGIILHPLQWDGNLADGREDVTLSLEGSDLRIRSSRATLLVRQHSTTEVGVEAED